MSPCRNPVFALEMIQTAISGSQLVHTIFKSQSSIRPGDDSDGVTRPVKRTRFPSSQSSIRPGDDSDKGESREQEPAQRSQSSIRPGDDSDNKSLLNAALSAKKSQSSIRPGDDSDKAELDAYLARRKKSQSSIRPGDDSDTFS